MLQLLRVSLPPLAHALRRARERADGANGTLAPPARGARQAAVDPLRASARHVSMPVNPRSDLAAFAQRAVQGVQEWEAGYGPMSTHESLALDPALVDGALDELIGRLHDNYPFFHPRYAGQMLKPPHPAAVAGYLAAMQINPNAHALDGGPATAGLEREVVAQLAGMFGF